MFICKTRQFSFCACFHQQINLYFLHGINETRRSIHRAVGWRATGCTHPTPQQGHKFFLACSAVVCKCYAQIYIILVWQLLFKDCFLQNSGICLGSVPKSTRTEILKITTLNSKFLWNVLMCRLGQLGLPTLFFSCPLLHHSLFY